MKSKLWRKKILTKLPTSRETENMLSTVMSSMPKKVVVTYGLFSRNLSFTSFPMSIFTITSAFRGSFTPL